MMSPQMFLRKLFVEHDVRHLVHERWSLLYGSISTRLAVLLYGGRLKIGIRSRIWGGVRFLIHGPGSITIGRDFHCVSSRKRSFITLFTPCHMTVIGSGQIVLGEHVGLNGTTIVCRKRISIGDNAMIAPNTIIIDHDGHAMWPPSERWIGKGLEAEIHIESDVWIGMNCMILKGVRIGRGSIIAAGSVVTCDVPPGCVYGGNPARKIKEFPAEAASDTPASH